MAISKLLKIDISTNTFLKALLIVGLVIFAYLVREVLLALAVAVIIAAAVDPLADFFEKRKIPRVLSILLVYVLIILLFGLILFLIIPPLANEMKQLAENAPSYVSFVSDRFVQVQDFVQQHNLADNFKTVLDRASNTLGQVTGNALGSVVSFFGGLASVLLVFFLSFYLVIEERRIKNFGALIVSPSRRKQIARLVNASQKKVGAWLRGQLILSATIFLVTWLALSLLGVKYALLLALIAGVLEIVPMIGPILAGIPAVLVGLSQGWWMGLIVLALYVVIQQLENHILVPKIMQKATGVSPVLVILGILAGAKLGGVLGMFIAIPIIAGLSVWVWEWINIRNHHR